MKVVLTGGTGFVGQNLAIYLEQKNYEISSISLREADWKKSFLLDAKAIIHLVGKAHDTSNNSDSDEYFRVNRDITIEVFNEFLISNIRDFFYFSSVKAVADSVIDVLDENKAASPLTPYGKSKIEAEEYLLNQKMPEGKRLFIIRPCMIHGPGNKGNLNLLYKIVEKGIPWPLASFHNNRSFLSIDNLSFLVEAMIQDIHLQSGIYNFADDDPISTNELVTLIAEVLGRKGRLICISPAIVRFLAKIGDVIPFPLNSERLKKLTESYIVSNQRIKDALNIDSLPVSTKDGLENTIRSFRKD
ncbi:NAD-dependent epimerase/dehydratase family protein [Sphingobacterium detergens]|uniref:NAD-dependent epimerase/dehydratase family protein n=1 Tax=Sphingobacterium detergens TaxID=1145106 RepID=UPI003AAE1C97